MFNIFKRPIHKESLESWTKILDDIAKVAILAIPVVLYGTNSVEFKIINAISLTISAYSCLFSADFLRKHKEEFTKE